MRFIPYKVTLDTNCIINVFDSEASTPTSQNELELILSLYDQGLLDLVVTTSFNRDQSRDQNRSRVQLLGKKLTDFNIGTISVPCHKEGDLSDKLRDELTYTVFPRGINPKSRSAHNKYQDIEHLVGHKCNDRDVFITDDHDILGKRDTLEDAHAITVMKPAEFVKFIQSKLSMPDYTDDSFPELYVSPALSGHVSFDYSNNDGRFRIGHNIYAFDTEWSKSGKTNIHAYSYSNNVASIARVTDVQNITELEDVSLYDYSSKHRSVCLNEILILRNTNGFYAAIKILNIQDDSRGDDNDLLEFEYMISKDGTFKES